MPDKKFEFDAIVRKHESINAGFIEFPFDVKKEFGKSRVKVKAYLDGHLYRGSLVKMGGKCHWLGIPQEVRNAIAKNPGDQVHVVLTEDAEERTVEIPEELKSRMEGEEGMTDFFNNLSFTHRKEYVRWITEAKREETRQNRIEKAIELLRKKVKTPG